MEADGVVKPGDFDTVFDCFHRVRLISPQEMSFAFVKAAWRDRSDDAKMESWKRPG